MAFLVNKTEIKEVFELVPRVFEDNRGAFAESYKQSDFNEIGIKQPIIQVNQSWNKQAVLRGLHYQKPPDAQAKLVVAVTGEVVDVAVDIRAGSPTYGQSVRRVLSAQTRNMLFIPEGFAHGFCVQSDEAQVVYYVFGSEYAPDAEAGIAWNDPALGIDWGVEEPVMSEKDLQLPILDSADNSFAYD